MNMATNIQSFEMKKTALRYDPLKSTLLCQAAGGKKLWIKKLYDLNSISDIIEDGNRYYIACDSGENSGQFLAVAKPTGNTDWFIPGKSFLHVLYKGHLFLIFADEESRFYLLKVILSSGKSAWYHPVDSDLKEYIFADNHIKLYYTSGRIEIVSSNTGKTEMHDIHVALRRV